MKIEKWWKNFEETECNFYGMPKWLLRSICVIFFILFPLFLILTASLGIIDWPRLK